MAIVIGIDLNIIFAHRVRREEADHRTRGEPFLRNQAIEQLERITVELTRLCADDRILEDTRESPGKLPGDEKRCPVDKMAQFFEWIVPPDLDTQPLRHGWCIAAPLDRGPIVAGLMQAQPVRACLPAFVPFAHALVFSPD